LTALSLGSVYGGVARMRRSWYERHPYARRRLSRPVVSIGNLRVGGTGKTPVVSALAKLLLSMGHRPAVLSRGYGRLVKNDGVTVVSDGTRVRVGVEVSGDEPQMLATALPGVPVLVSTDRHLAGRLAEQHFAVSVHLLDDGFQHLALARDVELLLLSPADLDEGVLPSGRLRESLHAARVADAVLVPGSQEDATRVARAVNVGTAFALRARYAPLHWSDDGTELPAGPHRLVAVSAIARPERFFDALTGLGHEVAGRLAFRDHHWFTAADLQRAAEMAVQARAHCVVTTAKDAVRLAAGTQWAVLPMELAIEPAADFAAWLAGRVGLPPAMGESRP
jgi:tetraacyldisaccharide 4'-kinase